MTLNISSPEFRRMLIALCESATRAVVDEDRSSHGFGPALCFECDYCDGSDATMRIGWRVLNELTGIGIDISIVPSNFGDRVYQDWRKERPRGDCLLTHKLCEILGGALFQHIQKKI